MLTKKFSQIGISMKKHGDLKKKKITPEIVVIECFLK
jgi:hypothetical protein